MFGISLRDYNRGEIYIYTLAKKIPNIWAKLEKLKPPPHI